MNKQRITIRLEPRLIEILKNVAQKHRTTYTEIMTEGTLNILKKIIDKKSIFESETSLEEIINLAENNFKILYPS
jgi:uncharacterized protein (DUF1778 family)